MSSIPFDCHGTSESSLQPQADELCKSLSELNNGIRSGLGGGVAGVWVIGQHGGLPVALVLGNDGSVGYSSAGAMPDGLDFLPTIIFRAGKLSLSACVNPLFTLTSSGGFAFLPNNQGLLETVLRDFFARNLCRKEPVPPKLDPYDPSRKQLRLGAAVQMASAAFQESSRAAKPADKMQFADRWAAEAFAYVTGRDTELVLLPTAAAKSLRPIREFNAHRDRRDLVSRALSECLTADEDSVSFLESNLPPSNAPYVQACRDSHQIFSGALEVARSGRGVNYKPFSQLLIKGALLAEPAGAVLRIGTAPDAIAQAYAPRFENALPHMSGADVFVVGRETPDFGVHPAGARSMSSFVTGRADGTVLDVPHVAFRADGILLDPRLVAHEFRHVRQELASECRLELLLGGRDDPDKETELEAKLEEAEFIRQFGILF